MHRGVLGDSIWKQYLEQMMLGRRYCVKKVDTKMEDYSYVYYVAA